MPGNQKVNLAAMIFIISKAFVDLRPAELRERVRRESIDRFTILKQSDDVMDGDAGVLHDRIPAADAGRANNVAVAFRDRAHISMVRVRRWGVKRVQGVARIGNKNLAAEEHRFQGDPSMSLDSPITFGNLANFSRDILRHECRTT